MSRNTPNWARNEFKIKTIKLAWFQFSRKIFDRPKVLDDLFDTSGKVIPKVPLNKIFRYPNKTRPNKIYVVQPGTVIEYEILDTKVMIQEIMSDEALMEWWISVPERTVRDFFHQERAYLPSTKTKVRPMKQKASKGARPRGRSINRRWASSQQDTHKPLKGQDYGFSPENEAANLDFMFSQMES